MPRVFLDYRGFIVNGAAQAKLLIPNDLALVGLRIYSAFVTLSPVFPEGVKSISNTFAFNITT